MDAQDLVAGDPVGGDERVRLSNLGNDTCPSAVFTIDRRPDTKGPRTLTRSSLLSVDLAPVRQLATESFDTIKRTRKSSVVPTPGR